MECGNLLKQFRKKPIIELKDLSARLDYKSNDIKKIIPHREPFLLIDKILGVDLNNEVIIGSRTIPKDDPVFKGHFPGFPVYPGSLQLEMIGQMGLCLYYFLNNKTDIIKENSLPLKILATKILGAYFLGPVFPGQEVLITAKKYEYDGYFGSVLGQVIYEGKICSAAVCEVCFME